MHTWTLKYIFPANATIKHFLNIERHVDECDRYVDIVFLDIWFFLQFLLQKQIALHLLSISITLMHVTELHSSISII